MYIYHSLILSLSLISLSFCLSVFHSFFSPIFHDQILRNPWLRNLARQARIPLERNLASKAMLPWLRNLASQARIPFERNLASHARLLPLVRILAR